MANVGKRRDLRQEFETADVGDARRLRRLLSLAEAIEEDPAASFPTATVTEAGLEGAYRFLNNDDVTTEGILAGHFQQTVERAAQEDVVIAAHDTTIFQFPGSGTRAGLGPLHGNGQGFFAHMTLLIAPGEQRRPLGVISFETIVRKRGGRRRTSTSKEQPESQRWVNGAVATEKRVDGRTSLIHVMDREGDAYPLWAALVAANHRFVIRIRHDRPLAESGSVRLSDAVAASTTIVERTVMLSPRREEKIVFNRRRHPARAGREARLALSATSVQVRRPPAVDANLPATLELNVVQVVEVGTNGANKPVEWLLITTEQVTTAADVEHVVDCYRSRWMIEEYFKVIKTGCAYEKRQLESAHALLNALAVFIPIAWQLLLLRTLARTEPDTPATRAITPTQVKVLRAMGYSALPPDPTARQVLLAIARLGGHITNNGEPGWIVLRRNFEKLLLLEQGWLARGKRSDQS
jgi:hypothetical protein